MARFDEIKKGADIVDIDEDNGGYNYYGYLRDDESWVIQRVNTAGTEIRYVAGSADYTTAWSQHTTLGYFLPTKYKNL